VEQVAKQTIAEALVFDCQAATSANGKENNVEGKKENKVQCP